METKQTKQKRITARCDDALYQKIEQEAKSAEMKISDYLRHIAAEYSVVASERDQLKTTTDTAQQRINELETQLTAYRKRGLFRRLFNSRP